METRKCSRCEERKPVSEFYKKGFNKQGIQQYTGVCRKCQAEYHVKYYAVKKPKLPGTRRQPKEFTDADEDLQYWPIGVAESIYKQFGMEWSYL